MSIWRAVSGSYICIAFAALILCDVGARLTYDVWTFDKFNSPNRSWIWWAAKDFRESPRSPDVVLLGSSLMMAALHGGDATYLNVPQNVAFHHRSTYMEKLLADQLHMPVSTFAFAIGGQMVSDAYSICSTLLRGERKPSVIVYGIAPRDFMDNMLTSAASTETFRYMSRLGGVRDVAISARTTFWEKAEYALSQVSFLYDHRLGFVYLQNKYARSILAHVGFKDLDFVHAPFPLRKIALLQLPEDNGPNELMIMPYRTDETFTDNLPEYRMRYKSFKKRLFDVQFAFLNRLAEYCQSQGIQLVLVNMPLTRDNVAIMPPGFYDFYMTSVRGAATKYDARFIDLNKPDVFDQRCFADSVHLNGLGGKKFFEVLSASLLDQARLADRSRSPLRLASDRRSVIK